jgi:acyl carrier protein
VAVPDTFERLQALIAAQLDVRPEKIGRETSFLALIPGDSLDFVEIVMAAEEEFGVQIPDRRAERVRTVEDLIWCIEGRPSPEGLPIPAAPPTQSVEGLPVAGGSPEEFLTTETRRGPRRGL